MFPDSQLVRINQLKFASSTLEQEIDALCEKARESHWVDKEILWLGALFREEIEAGYMAPCEVRFINPEVGYGLFATEKLIQGDYIGEYVGVVDRKRWWHLFRSSDYSFRYPTFRWTYRRYTIDSTIYCNETHYINHSAVPNLDALSAMGSRHMHVIFRANRTIEAGEQLFFDYGPVYWRSRGAPIALEGIEIK